MVRVLCGRALCCNYFTACYNIAMKTITSMKAWMSAATVQEQELLAQKVGTTRGSLYQYAGGHRRASAERDQLAQKVFTHTDLCDACLHCAYAQKCLGARAVVSEFPIVDSRQLDLDL